MKNYFVKIRKYIILTTAVILLLALILSLLFILKVYPFSNSFTSDNPPQWLPVLESATPEGTIESPIETQAARALPNAPPSGAVLLSLMDGQYYHLFMVQPGQLSLTRLTNSNWDDIQPSLSPDGTKIAFSSRRNGYWDLYIWSITDGSLQRVTDTPQFEGWPCWSPDGQWLAYSGYTNDSLNLFVLNLAEVGSAPYQLTDWPESESQPAWSPAGREIAFMSTHSGNQDIWLARLDNVENRFTNLTQSAAANESHPAWSSDGLTIAWSSDLDHNSDIYLWNSQSPDTPPDQIGLGDWPVYDQTGGGINTIIQAPNQTILSRIDFISSPSAAPAVLLPGKVLGFSWLPAVSVGFILNQTANINQATPTPNWNVNFSLQPGPSGRRGVVEIPDVKAPYAFLQDAVDESFNALRKQSAQEAGWDILANLENAYLPLTEPPAPGEPDNWLFTGRAFSILTSPMQAGWMTAVKEEINGQVYWRVFVKARYQDGSQGLPLDQAIWDINARFLGDPRAYENGGQLKAPPSGYWVDFTELAFRFGWQRLAALSDWRSYYPSTLINQFVNNSGLDWGKAMREIYSAEAMATYTPIPSRTPTPTATPKDSETPIPTRTSTPTTTPSPTPTFRPTWTPSK